MTLAFTEEQQDAICAQDRNLLIAAGAGSGKTTVLVERIIRWVEAGGSISRLLALTFTNAAALGMRNRIGSAMEALLQTQPYNNHLRRELALLPQASISTIHSFCLDLLRREGGRIGLTPSFRVAGDLEKALLYQETMDNLLEMEYADAASSLPDLADAYGGNRDDEGIAKLISRLYTYACSRPHPEQWLQECSSSFCAGVELDTYAFAHFLDEDLSSQLTVLATRLRRLCGMRGVAAVRIRQVQDEADMIQQVADLSDCLEQRLRMLAEIRFTTLKSIGKAKQDYDAAGNIINIYDETAQDSFKQQRSEIREQIRELQKKYCTRTVAQHAEDLAHLQPLMQELVRLTLRYGEMLRAEKQRRDIIDFNDMEHLTLALLADEGVSCELQQMFDQILVDEYQDINEVQEAILSQLAAQCNLFVVGDVKQSIYRFRLAEPALFLDKYRRYGELAGGRRIDLNLNYRSTRSIIHGVNFIFSQLMREQATEIEYNADAYLQAGRQEEGPPPELHIIDLSTQAEEEALLSRLQVEGRLIAQRALQLRAEGYSYGQMAVLLRASKDKEHFIADALREAGIPSVSDTAADYRESPEVALLLAALQTIDNPQQDIPLVSVLRSPLVGFSADELMEIRLLSPTGNYYQALQLAAESDIPGSTRVRCFLQRLQQWREWAGQGTLNELLHRLSRENGFYHMLGAMPDGPHRQQNIRLLIEQARDYDENHFAGLFRFVQQIHDGQLLNVKDNTHIHEESQDAVQIMTIHKSKGLEFPIVFVAGLSSNFNAQDERDDVIWERELGLGARLADRERRCKYNTLSHLAVARKLSRLALAEELRVLYVAMTRAKERLILSAALPLSRNTCSRWLLDVDTEQRALPVHKILSARSPLDWLIPALLRHPDAECLRTSCGDPGILLSSQGHWQVSLHAVSSICAPAPNVTISEDLEVVFDEKLSQAVARALDYEYPQAELCVYPAKWSVSALNRMEREQAEEESVLLPAAEPELLIAENLVNPDSTVGADLAAQRGSAYHRVLELLDLQDVSMEGLSSQCLAMQHLLDIHQLDLSRLAHFFASDLGQRYCRADRVERERPFTYLLPISDEAKIMVQGVLDAAFYEDGAWVLLDYKTGGWGKSDQEIAAQYREQLYYYRQAIERLWGQPVKECWLCMLDLERNILL